MIVRAERVLLALALVALVVAAGGCRRVTTRVNPERVGATGTATVVVKLANGSQVATDVTPSLKIIDGEECGTVDATPSKRDDGRWFQGTFTASGGVENCVATIQASIGKDTATTRALVSRFDPKVRIDGVSAIAAILIASFAIDRVTTFLLFLASWVRRGGRRTRGSDLVADAGRQRMPYYIVAGVLGAVVLGGFGDVRVLGALGFVSVNPYLDALITGLVLMVGADRASDLLQKFDVPGAAASKKPAAPIEVTGRLVLENPDVHRGERSPV
jgi:hypothetical protein